jgi:hypothetical protein
MTGRAMSALVFLSAELRLTRSKIAEEQKRMDHYGRSLDRPRTKHEKAMWLRALNARDVFEADAAAISRLIRKANAVKGTS